MYTMQLEWKRPVLSGDGSMDSPYVYGDIYPICLDSVDAFMRDNAGDDYCGLSANSKLEIHFTSEPSQEIKDLVATYHASLTPDSPEALAYCSQEAKQAKIEELRQGMLAKSWDQMSLAERKIMLNQTPSKAELGL